MGNKKVGLERLPNNLWQTILSKKYFDATVNLTADEVNTEIFKVGAVYHLNLPRIKKYHDLFYLEVFEPSVHKPETDSKLRPLSVPTVRLLLFYSVYRDSKENINPNLLCLGSYVGRIGDIDVTENGVVKSVNRMWCTKFLYGQTVIVYQWHENPKVLKAYYNLFARRRLRPFSGRRFLALNTTTLKSFSDHRAIVLYKT